MYRSGPPDPHFRDEREPNDDVPRMVRFADARATEDIAKGASGTVMLVSRLKPSDAGTDIKEVTAYNRFGAVTDGSELELRNDGGGWLITMAECG